MRIGYRPELDGIRGLMTITVFLFHVRVPKIGGGFLSVDVFFALSGFLITALLLEEASVSGTIAMGRFYARRAARLLPALILGMILVASLPLFHDQAAKHASKVYRGILASLFYVNNWASALEWFYPYATTQTWSLSIEEQFYIVWPWVVLFATRTKRPLIWTAAAATAGILLPIWARAAQWRGVDDLARVYFGTDTRADTIFWGTLLAVLWRSGIVGRVLSNRISAALAAWGGAALLAYAFWALRKTRPDYYSWGLPFVAVASCIMIAGMMADPGGLIPRIFRVSPLVWLGRRSYAFYLFHWPIVWAADFRRGNETVTRFTPTEILLIAAASLLLTQLSWTFAEQPILAAARRRFSRPE